MRGPSGGGGTARTGGRRAEDDYLVGFHSHAMRCASAIVLDVPPPQRLGFSHHQLIEPRLGGLNDLLIEGRNKRID